MEFKQLERSVEAVLFASGEPVEAARICEALGIDEKMVRNLIERIRERYLGQQSPFDIVALGESFQMCTLPEYGEAVRSVLELRKASPLSAAALEVLAVIAYNQPVTRAFIEQVRGVDCSSIVRGLCDKALIEEAGRLPVPGKPIAYRTTANFLRSFGIESLSQLPEIPELPPDEPSEDEPVQLDGQMDFFE